MAYPHPVTVQRRYSLPARPSDLQPRCGKSCATEAELAKFKNESGRAIQVLSSRNRVYSHYIVHLENVLTKLAEHDPTFPGRALRDAWKTIALQSATIEILADSLFTASK